ALAGIASAEAGAHSVKQLLAVAACGFTISSLTGRHWVSETGMMPSNANSTALARARRGEGGCLAGVMTCLRLQCDGAKRCRSLTFDARYLPHKAAAQPAPQLTLLMWRRVVRNLRPRGRATPRAAFHFSESYSTCVARPRRGESSIAPNPPSSVRRAAWNAREA